MISNTVRLLFPAAILAYAAYGLVSALPSLERKIAEADWSGTDWLKGRATAAIDDAWREDLPHQSFASGIVGAGRWLALGEGRKGVVAGRNGWLFTDEEARQMPEPMEAVFARIDILRQTLAEKGIELVIVPLAGKADIYRDEVINAGMARDLERRYNTVLAGLRAMDIPSVDSRAALVKAAADAQVFYSSDTHWTREGAASVAQAVAAIVPHGEAEVSIIEEAARQFNGDLTKFITSGELAPKVGLPEETAHPFIAQIAAGDDLGDLFGPASVANVLVGTSYSANPNWSFSESLKLDLRADILNYAKEGQGPVKPFFEMLADAAFQEAPPERVIWEMPVRYLSDPSIWALPDGLDTPPMLAGNRPAATLAQIGAEASPIRLADLPTHLPTRYAQLASQDRLDAISPANLTPERMQSHD